MNDAPMQQTDLYFFLARVFAREVDAEFLRQLRSPDFQSLMQEFEVELDRDLLNKEDGVVLEELAIEYSGCFVGPGQFVSPQESIHHERQDCDWGKYWGADTAALKKFIEAAGMQIQAPFAGLPDHISVELEFVGQLGRAVNEKLAAGDQSEALYGLRMKRRFFDDHLLQWAPAFCDKTIAIAERPFYAELAGLLKALLELEDQTLGEALEGLTRLGV